MVQDIRNSVPFRREQRRASTPSVQYKMVYIHQIDHPCITDKNRWEKWRALRTNRRCLCYQNHRLFRSRIHHTLELLGFGSQRNLKSNFRGDLSSILILCFGNRDRGQHRREDDPNARIGHMLPRTNPSSESERADRIGLLVPTS